MKKSIVLLLMLLSLGNVFAVTDVTTTEIAEKVYAVNILSAETTENGFYAVGLHFIPETQNAPAVVTINLGQVINDEESRIEFKNHTAVLQIMCNDDLLMNYKAHPKFILGYASDEDPTIATISCREDYDYLLSLLKRNNGDCEFAVVIERNKIFNFTLEYSQEEFESLLELASIVNLGKIPEGGV